MTKREPCIEHRGTCNFGQRSDLKRQTIPNLSAQRHYRPRNRQQSSDTGA